MLLVVLATYYNLTAVVLLVLIITNITLGHKFINRTSRYMILLYVSTILVLLSNTVLRILIETENPNIPWVDITTVLFFLFALFPAIPWLLYFDSYMSSGEYSLKQRWYFLLPAIISTVFMIISIFTGFIFHVDGAGGYFKGPGLFIFHVINYVLFIIAVVLIIKKHGHVSGRLMSGCPNTGEG